MIHYHAAWIVPICGPPMRDGWVTVDRGRIVAATARNPGAGAREVDLGDVAVMPGLVNAHTHLELSYLRDEVPPASQFVTWIRHVIAARRARPDAGSAEILAAIERAIDEAIASGTALVGDISNTLVTFAPLARSALAGVVFYELIQFAAPDPRGDRRAAPPPPPRRPRTRRSQPRRPCPVQRPQGGRRRRRLTGRWCSRK